MGWQIIKLRYGLCKFSLTKLKYRIVFVKFPANGTCMFNKNETNVVSFYNDLEIRESNVELPAGATIVSR